MNEVRFREALARDRRRQIEKLPFTIVRDKGVVHVDAKVDAAFRKALMDGVPPQIRSKMREALAATPGAHAMEHSIRYFGGQAGISDVKNRIALLLVEFNRLLTESFALPGIFDWLEVTGFGNDYRMIKAFLAWAEMAKTPSLGQVPASPLRSPTYG
jgi:hypothetical protein